MANCTFGYQACRVIECPLVLSTSGVPSGVEHLSCDQKVVSIEDPYTVVCNCCGFF